MSQAIFKQSVRLSGKQWNEYKTFKPHPETNRKAIFRQGSWVDIADHNAKLGHK